MINIHKPILSQIHTIWEVYRVNYDTKERERLTCASKKYLCERYLDKKFQEIMKYDDQDLLEYIDRRPDGSSFVFKGIHTGHMIGYELKHKNVC